jgi:hypothetical protein
LHISLIRASPKAADFIDFNDIINSFLFVVTKIFKMSKKSGDGDGKDGGGR